ncbi:MAG: hypothetical protein LBP42_02470 [Treponema sp.]|jgi:hypothetical protein|nr:hypothetical protein [Treponema sp.]
MIVKTDLYTILKSYAEKINSPYIGVNDFISTLELYAGRRAKEQPEWLKWAQNTAEKFWLELAPLTEQGLCELISGDDPEQWIYLPQYYVELIQRAYQTPDKNVELPFPSEESLSIHLPEDGLKILHVDRELAAYLEENGNTTDDPNTILRIVFPDTIGSALTLSSMVPHRILETALLKVRNYLRNEGNRDYARHKLTVQLQGREAYLNDTLDQLVIRPLEYLTKMAEGGENSAFFWVCFCSMVRNDINKKNERLPEDLAVLEAVYLIDACNGFYQLRAIKKRDRELALKNLELRLENSPFLYSLEDITKFTNNKGILLMGQYSPEDLDQYIKTKTVPAADDTIPELLIISGTNYERWFVKKSKLIPLCMRLLNEARPQIKRVVENRWEKLLRQYRKEAAMNSDEEFEKLLGSSIEKHTSALNGVLKSKWLYLVYDEAIRNREINSTSARLYINGALVPYAALLMLNRKNILNDTRILLPFWYSIPFIVMIISFFKGMQRKSKTAGTSEDHRDGEEEPAGSPSADSLPGVAAGSVSASTAGSGSAAGSAAGAPAPGSAKMRERDHARELRRAARELEKTLVPQGHTTDNYLVKLEEGWGKLLNKEAKKDMLEDVNALIRDRLRQNLRLKRQIKLDQNSLNAMADGIITSNPSLQSLPGQDSLRLYITIYLVKYLANGLSLTNS